MHTYQSSSKAATVAAYTDDPNVFHISVRSAGLSPDSELKVALACQLLIASNIRVDLQPWNGNLCDLLVADVDTPQGRHAYQVVARLQGKVLTFGEHGGAAATLTPHMSAAMIEKSMRRALLENLYSEPSLAESSLLALCRRATATNLLVRKGPFSVMLRRQAGRIATRMHSDLLAARTHITHGAWRAMAVADDLALDGTWSISQSLDAFMIDACRDRENRLPALTKMYRLQAWPDVGSLHADSDALRLSSLLMSASWSVDALARHCRTSVQRANGFCWATLASGALVETASQPPHADTLAPSAPARPATTLPMLLRLAKRFGLDNGDRADGEQK